MKNIDNQQRTPVTGWHKMDGEWIYLYSGGAVGANSLIGVVREGLEHYCLDTDYKGEDEAADMAQAVRITGDIPDRVSVPLVALAFLAPLRSAMERAGCPPTFCAWLIGYDGTYKSTLAALALGYFGSFSDITLPASFYDTCNYVYEKASGLDDALFCVDEYYYSYTNDAHLRRQKDKIAWEMIRATDRRTKHVRMGQQPTKAERKVGCLTIFTGSDIPSMNDSEKARCYVVNMDDHARQIKPANLMQYKALAERGVLARLMRRYLEWLAPKMDMLPALLAERYRKWLSAVKDKTFASVHQAFNAAHLLVGYETYLQFLGETGLWRDHRTFETLSQWHTICSKLGSVTREKWMAEEMDMALRTIAR